MPQKLYLDEILLHAPVACIWRSLEVPSLPIILIITSI